MKVGAGERKERWTVTGFYELSGDCFRRAVDGIDACRVWSAVTRIIAGRKRATDNRANSEGEICQSGLSQVSGTGWEDT